MVSTLAQFIKNPQTCLYLSVSSQTAVGPVNFSVKMATLSIYAVVLVLSLLSLVHCKVSPELQVTLSHGGELNGTFMTSHRGHGIRVFLGIPYAEPPLKELRFQPPVPKSPWTGSIQASNGKRECPQAFGASIIGDEDCLYLNVYAPLVSRRV